jgi:hypothetical protein
MKTIDIQSKIMLRSVIRHLVQSMELLNQISEEDYRKIVLAAQKKKDCQKGVTDNAGRGNLFMQLFFFREWVETLLNSQEE